MSGMNVKRGKRRLVQAEVEEDTVVMLGRSGDWLGDDGAVLAAEGRFFASLSKGDQESLESIVDEDCILIDVMTGSEVPRETFVELVGSQRLVFESIERLDARVRLYDSTAIVTGQTRMTGHFDGQKFQVHSRYTHVYAHGRDGWRLVTAQGTSVA